MGAERHRDALTPLLFVLCPVGGRKQIPCILADTVGLGHLEVRGGQRAWAGGRADPEARSQQPATRAAPPYLSHAEGESEAFEPAFTRQAGEDAQGREPKSSLKRRRVMNKGKAGQNW